MYMHLDYLLRIPFTSSHFWAKQTRRLALLLCQIVQFLAQSVGDQALSLETIIDPSATEHLGLSSGRRLWVGNQHVRASGCGLADAGLAVKAGAKW